MATYTNSVRFVCNGALRFHAAPGTYVTNIHKTLLKRRAFPCFHRPIAAGTPNDRQVIHTILHSPTPRQSLLVASQTDFLSASGRTGLSNYAGSLRGDFEFRRAVKPL